MSEKTLPKEPVESVGLSRPKTTRVTATEFKTHQGSFLKKVVEGARLALTWRGKKVASIEPIQSTLAFEVPQDPKELERELSDLTQKMEPDNQDLIKRISEGLAPHPENLELTVRIARGFVKKTLKNEK